MNNEKSRPYGGHEAEQLNDKSTSKLAFGMAAVAAGGAIAMGVMHNSAPAEQAANAKIEVAAEQVGLDKAIAGQLLALQAVNEQRADAPNEIPASLRLVSVSNFTIETGLVADATKKYKELNGLAEDANVPDEVAASIVFTAKSEVEYKRANGENSHPQPNEEFGLVTVEDEDGTDYAIVSGPVILDTN